MVNFNDETTMTRPRRDVVNFMILQQLQDLLDKYYQWEIEIEKGTHKETQQLKAHILKLIMLIRTPLDKRMEKDTKSKYKNIEEVRTILITATDEDIRNIIDYLENFLYDKDVTQWDTKEKVDRKDVWGTKQNYLG